jgi:hypothetical protein
MAIQFPAGHGADSPQTAVAGIGSAGGLTPARNATAAAASASEAPVDSFVLQSGAAAALDPDLLRDLNDGASRALGAAEFQLAREAAQVGDRVASLQHLEQAILSHPMHAEAARQDADFDAIRGPVLDLVGRVSILARMRAESSIAEALSALDSVRAPHATEPLAQARTYSDLAQAQFQQGSYAGYVEAAQAAIRAQQIAAGIKIEPDFKLAAARAAGVADSPRRVTRLLGRATRRLWQRLPLLAILLGWLFAGIIGGVAALPFREGAVVEMRRILFPIWAMGILGMVLIGFICSILRLRGTRLR